jgi:hypothetical protein
MEIEKASLQWHPAYTSALESIMVVTILGDAKTFKSVIDKMTYGTDFKLIN